MFHFVFSILAVSATVIQVGCSPRAVPAVCICYAYSYGIPEKQALHRTNIVQVQSRLFMFSPWLSCVKAPLPNNQYAEIASRVSEISSPLNLEASIHGLYSTFQQFQSVTKAEAVYCAAHVLGQLPEKKLRILMHGKSKQTQVGDSEQKQEKKKEEEPTEGIRATDRLHQVFGAETSEEEEEEDDDLLSEDNVKLSAFQKAVFLNILVLSDRKYQSGGYMPRKSFLVDLLLDDKEVDLSIGHRMMIPPGFVQTQQNQRDTYFLGDNLLLLFLFRFNQFHRLKKILSSSQVTESSTFVEVFSTGIKSLASPARNIIVTSLYAEGLGHVVDLFASIPKSKCIFCCLQAGKATYKQVEDLIMNPEVGEALLDFSESVAINEGGKRPSSFALEDNFRHSKDINRAEKPFMLSLIKGRKKMFKDEGSTGFFHFFSGSLHLKGSLASKRTLKVILRKTINKRLLEAMKSPLLTGNPRLNCPLLLSLITSCGDIELLEYCLKVFCKNVVPRNYLKTFKKKTTILAKYVENPHKHKAEIFEFKLLCNPLPAAIAHGEMKMATFLIEQYPMRIDTDYIETLRDLVEKMMTETGMEPRRFEKERREFFQDLTETMRS